MADDKKAKTAPKAAKKEAAEKPATKAVESDSKEKAPAKDTAEKTAPNATSKKETKSDLAPKLQKIIDAVEKLTVLELADLVKALEDKFGVSAAAPVAVAAAPGTGNGTEAPAEEKSEFDVVLKDAGGNKIAVIKAVREIDQNLGLIDAKKLVESLPQTLLEGAKKEEAEATKTKLEEAGAQVELK